LQPTIRRAIPNPQNRKANAVCSSANLSSQPEHAWKRLLVRHRRRIDNPHRLAAIAGLNPLSGSAKITATDYPAFLSGSKGAAFGFDRSLDEHYPRLRAPVTSLAAFERLPEGLFWQASMP
jgi:hypothetical protein